MTIEPLFHGKPWEFRGRKMERNAPRGTRCTPGCSHPRPNIGTSTALCTVCHESFNTVSNYDRHRRDGWCLNPEEIGLRKASTGHWVYAATPEEIERLRTFRRVEKGAS
jgi:hypothetical protein